MMLEATAGSGSHFSLGGLTLAVESRVALDATLPLGVLDHPRWPWSEPEPAAWLHLDARHPEAAVPYARKGAQSSIAYVGPVCWLDDPAIIAQGQSRIVKTGRCRQASPSCSEQFQEVASSSGTLLLWHAQQLIGYQNPSVRSQAHTSSFWNRATDPRFPGPSQYPLDPRAFYSLSVYLEPLPHRLRQVCVFVAYNLSVAVVGVVPQPCAFLVFCIVPQHRLKV